MKIQLLISQGRHKDAEALIREDLTESIDEPILYFFLALALLNQDKPKQAEEVARQAIQLEPEDGDNFFILARCLSEQKKKPEALKAVDQAIALDAYDADYFALKTQIYYETRKFKQAIEAAEAGLEIDPESESCRFYYGILLEHFGRKEEAEAVSLGLLADNPEDYTNHNARGWVLIQAGDADAAERHFIQALRINPESEDAKTGLIYALSMRNRVLGWMLKTLLWLGRFPYGAVIGAVLVGSLIAGRIARSDLPPPVPQIGVVVILVMMSFFLISLMIQPIFNFVMSRSKTARHALNDRQQTAVKWFMLPMALSLVFLNFWIFKGTGRSLPYLAVGWASLTAMIHESFEVPVQTVRRWMFGVTLLILAVVIWLHYATFVVLVPEAMAIMNMPDDVAAITRMRELFDYRYKLVVLPAYAVWFAAAFSDNIRDFIWRRVADE